MEGVQDEAEGGALAMGATEEEELGAIRGFWRQPSARRLSTKAATHASVVVRVHGRHARRGERSRP